MSHPDVTSCLMETQRSADATGVFVLAAGSSLPGPRQAPPGDEQLSSANQLPGDDPEHKVKG